MDYKNKNILDAFWCSIDGLKILFKEKAARRELLLVIFSILYIFLMQPDLNMIIWLIVLPLLMLITFLFSLSRLTLTKELALSVSLVIVGLSLLYVRHLQSWVAFKDEFQAILKEEKGFVDPADHGNIDHWGWTNPLLSYVWAEGQVKSVILNRNFENGYEPFDPFTEMVMENYLDQKPSFLRQKKEE